MSGMKFWLILLVVLNLFFGFTRTEENNKNVSNFDPNLSEMFLTLLKEWELSSPVFLVSDPAEYLQVRVF